MGIKHKNLYLLMLIVILFISSCNYNTMTKEEKELTNLIKKIEVSNLNLMGKKFTVEEYERETKNLSIYSIEYFDGKYPLYTKSEYEKLHEDRPPIALEKVTVKISKVYDIDYDDNLDNKFIYVQVIYSKWSVNKYDLIYNKRYELTKEEGKWIIREMVWDVYDIRDLEGFTNFEGQEFKPHIPKFNKHDGEDIDFVEVIKGL